MKLFNKGFIFFIINLTTNPVIKADITVPSLVPIILKSKNTSDKTTASTTQPISKATFTLPKIRLYLSEIALTKASPFSS